MRLFQMLKEFLKKNRREVLRLVGITLFLAFIYTVAHGIMQEEKPVQPLPVIIVEEDDDDTETDLRFPIMEETEEATESTVYEQIKTIKMYPVS